MPLKIHLKDKWNTTWKLFSTSGYLIVGFLLQIFSDDIVFADWTCTADRASEPDKTFDIFSQLINAFQEWLDETEGEHQKR